MNEKRLQQLLSMQASDPNDPFLPYAIAQEYVSAGDNRSAAELFQKVTVQFPDYLAAYHQLGLAMIALGDVDQAANYLQTGINLAKQQGNRKAENEMKELLEDISD